MLHINPQINQSNVEKKLTIPTMAATGGALSPRLVPTVKLLGAKEPMVGA